MEQVRNFFWGGAGGVSKKTITLRVELVVAIHILRVTAPKIDLGRIKPPPCIGHQKILAKKVTLVSTIFVSDNPVYRNKYSLKKYSLRAEIWPQNFRYTSKALNI